MLSHQSLQRGGDAPGVVGESFAALGSGDRREIPDGVAERRETVDRFGPAGATPAAESEQDQPLTVLRDAEAEAVQYARLDAVAEGSQRFVEAGEHGAVVPAGKVGDVLDHHRLGVEVLDDRDERGPQVGAGVVAGTHAGGHEVAEFRAAGPTEGLAGHAAGHEVDRIDAPGGQRVEEFGGVGQVS